MWDHGIDAKEPEKEETKKERQQQNLNPFFFFLLELKGKCEAFNQLRV